MGEYGGRMGSEPQPQLRRSDASLAQSEGLGYEFAGYGRSEGPAQMQHFAINPRLARSLLVPLFLCAGAWAQLPGKATMAFLGDIKDPKTNLAFSVPQDRLDPPKFSPQKFGDSDPQPYEFDWEVLGYGRIPTDTEFKEKFRVFTQIPTTQKNPAPSVARMLLRLWDMNYRRFKFDHKPVYNGGVVDVYLCFGGEPGGQQRFDIDYEGKPPREEKVDTIYIFDLASFTDPVEMAREVAHEYGHAVLTPVGGFQTPEDWGNGQLGEKLFLRWCRDEMAAGHITSEDVMGASLKGLDGWVKRRVDPLVVNEAANAPDLFDLLLGQGQGAMDAFTGLVCYADTIFPEDVVGRSLKLMQSTSAGDYPPALLEACEEKQRVVLGIPDLLQGKDLWVPLGKGTVQGGQVIRRRGDWALIRPGLTATTLIYG